MSDFISDEREREILDLGTSSEAVAESSRVYKKKIQEESLEGMPEHIKYFYILTDYLGITNPDQRIERKIRKADASCIKQKVLITQYEKRISQQEQLITDKERELGDSTLYFEKRKNDIEEAVMMIERLEEEKQEQQNRRNPDERELSDRIAELDNSIIDSNQRLRKYEREKNELAAKIIETESFIQEAENVLVSTQVYSSALHNNYLRSRVERMRLAPLIGVGKKPVETIGLIVEDQKIAEDTGRLADAMTLWVGEITEQIAGMRITPRQREGVYSDLKRKHSASNTDLVSAAEKLIENKRKGKYVS